MDPFIIQTSLHYTAIQFGHIAFLLGLLWFVGSLLNRFLLNYYDTRSILTIGLGFMVILTASITLIMPHIPFRIMTVAPPLLVIYITGSLLMSYSFVISLSLFPKLGGTINAISGVGIMMLTSVITLLSSQFSTQTQMPLMYFYFSMSVIALLTYFSLMRSR